MARSIEKLTPRSRKSLARVIDDFLHLEEAARDSGPHPHNPASKPDPPSTPAPQHVACCQRHHTADGQSVAGAGSRGKPNRHVRRRAQAPRLPVGVASAAVSPRADVSYVRHVAADGYRARVTSARNRWTSGLALSAMALGLAAVGIFVALAIVVTASYTPPPGQEPPKVTDWMQGWASIVGVAAALVAAGFTGWLLRFEMNQAREARAELAAEQRKANLKRRVASSRRKSTRHGPTTATTSRERGSPSPTSGATRFCRLTPWLTHPRASS